MKRTRLNPWPVAIVAWFVLFLGATAAFILLSVRSQRVDLVARDYYAQEIQYQGQIDRIQRTRSLAAPVTLAYDAARQEIAIKLPRDHAGQQPAGRIHLYRPSDASLDRQLLLEPDASGLQTLNARSLAPGLWKVRLLWTVAGAEYFHDQTFVVKGS